MSRVITYLTTPAGDANTHVRMGRAMVLLMDMYRSGMALRSYRAETRACMDYALESPDEIPAGGCQQYEIETGDEENGIPGYCVSALQITVKRDDE